MNIEDQDLLRLTNNPGLDGSPRWSPDQQFLAYISEGPENEGSASDIYSVAVANRATDRVTFEVATEELGEWAPGGEWLVFYTREPLDQTGLWIRNPVGVNLIKLTDGEDSQPAWSPDGKYIAFVRQEGGAQVIYVVHPIKGDAWDAGVREMRLTHGGFDDSSPVWRPDSKTIAFVSNRDGNQEIYTMKLDGSQQQRLTSNSTVDDSPVWSPKGDRLAFVTYLHGSADILVMNADGTEQRRLTRDSGNDSMPDW